MLRLLISRAIPANCKSAIRPGLVLAGLLLLSSCQSTSPEATAAYLSQQHLLVDTHIDVPFRLYRKPADISVANSTGEFDYPKAVAGGVNGAFMSIYIPATVDAAGDSAALANELIDLVEQIVENAPTKFTLAYCADDIERAQRKGLVALPLGMENGGPIDGSFEQLRHFRDRGIRYVTLTHSKANHISDSSYDPAQRWHGLSPFGATLVEAMNNEGVMIDVSHISDEAFWQVMHLSKTPVIASHSSLRHFTPGFERNMSDAMVRALGQAGGVVQINFGTNFLTATAQAWSSRLRSAQAAYIAEQGLAADDPAIAEFRKDYRVSNPYPFATIDDVLDHIDRTVELAGIDAVGLGSDYDGVGDSLPVGLKHAGDYPNLIQGLLERGYSEEAIEKILGGNLLRVWAAVESYASSQGTAINCVLEG